MSCIQEPPGGKDKSHRTHSNRRVVEVCEIDGIENRQVEDYYGVKGVEKCCYMDNHTAGSKESNVGTIDRIKKCTEQEREHIHVNPGYKRM